MSSWPQECEIGTKEAEIMGIQESRTEKNHWQRKHSDSDRKDSAVVFSRQYHNTQSERNSQSK